MLHKGTSSKIFVFYLEGSKKSVTVFESVLFIIAKEVFCLFQ